MKKNFLFAAAAVVAMSSCSMNEITANPASADNAIGFSVYTGVANKGAEVTSETLKDFGVFGFYTEGKTFAEYGSKAANFMYNTEVSYGTDWTYSPMKYWSEDNADKYTFYAYHPFSDNAQVFLVGDKTNHPKVRVTVPATVADMVDFVADVQVDVTSGTDETVAVPAVGDKAATVEFAMQHEMTRVAVNLKSDVEGNTYLEQQTTIVVKDIKFQGAEFATSGTYTFATAKDARGTWTITGNATLNPSLTPNNKEIGSGTPYVKEQGVAVVNGATDATSLFGKDQYLFLLPPNGETGLATAGEIAIELTYDIVTEDNALQYGHTASIDNVKTVNIPANSLKQGVAYNYTIVFSMNEVTLSAKVDDAGWGTEK